MLGPRLNRSRVVRAAIYDLLSSQCDRHAQNVFITEQGEVKLIDNLQVRAQDGGGKVTWVGVFTCVGSRVLAVSVRVR